MYCFVDGSSSSQTSQHQVSGINFLSSVAVSSQSTATNATNTQLQFKSPNVVCPSDSVVPRVNSSSTTSTSASSSSKPFGGPFPFTSMNQAIHGGNRESNFSQLPPPYPGKHPPVTISSPLLVNLLQNDGTKDTVNNPKGQQPLRPIRTPPAASPKVVMTTVSSTTTTMSTFIKPNSIISNQADVLATNNVSPSALSTTYTSIRKPSSTTMTSTSNKAAIKTPPPLPPQYHRGLVSADVLKHVLEIYSHFKCNYSFNILK